MFWRSYGKSQDCHWSFSALHLFLSSAFKPSLRHILPLRLFFQPLLLEVLRSNQSAEVTKPSAHTQKTHTPARWPALCQPPRIMPGFLIPLKIIITHTEWPPFPSGNNVFNLDQPAVWSAPWPTETSIYFVWYFRGWSLSRCRLQGATSLSCEQKTVWGLVGE